MRLNPAFGRLGDENAFKVLARANMLAAEGRDIINLGIGQPDFPTPEHIVEAGIKALRDGHHGYTPATGIPRLKEAVADDLAKRSGFKISPENILIAPGGKVTMHMAIMMFGTQETEIIYPDPGFPIYRSMIDFTGAKAVPVSIREENGFAISAKDILSRITDKTRLIIINSPANPTGGATPKSEIDKLVNGLGKHPDVAILSDEIYSRMLFDGLEHQSLAAYPSIRDRLIILDGWSKTYAMTGWRLGWSLWPDKLIDLARKFAVNSYSCVNASAQYAGLAAITGPQDCVTSMVDEFDRRRKLVVTKLNAIQGIRCATPKGAFYAFPNISKTGFSGNQLSHTLLEDYGVATVAGMDFGNQGKDFIRLSFANSFENIEKALERIDTCIARAN